VTGGAFGGVRGPIKYQRYSRSQDFCYEEGTYEGNSAVCAPANLGLIRVDEDPRVTKGTTASIARHDALVCPANGLLVDEFDGSVWTGLDMFSLANALDALCPSVFSSFFILFYITKSEAIPSQEN
jgi:hypothetical protein